MKKQRKGLILCLVAMLAVQLCIGAYAQSNNQNGQVAKNNIVEVLKKENKQFTTLTKAIEAAGLVATLEGQGPYTMFAPTDRAFEQLPKGTLDTLLKPENKDKLTDILTYHVSLDELPSEAVGKLNGKEITMVNDRPAKIEVKDGSVYIDGAKILKTDIKASNGIIHVIDTVLMP